MIRELLRLGDPALYEVSVAVQKEELPEMIRLTADLQDTLLNFRTVVGRGRAISAPQIGVHKRVIYEQIEEPIVMINPVLTFPDEEWMEVLDDCMSFPGLMVHVMRYRRCIVRYRDLDWNPCERTMEGNLSQLIQHECDHLNGILSTMRALDDKSFVMRPAP